MKDFAKSLFYDRGLALAQSVVRWVPMSGAPIVSVVKSGTPTEGAWLLTFVAGIQVTATRLMGASSSDVIETVSDGGNSTTLIPGLTITYPATAVVGSAIVTVSRFGDPVFDQHYDPNYLYSSIGGSTETTTLVDASAQIALGYKRWCMSRWSIEGTPSGAYAPGHYGRFRLFQGSTDRVRSDQGSASGSEPRFEVYTPAFVFDLADGDVEATLTDDSAASLNILLVTRGWLE